MTSSKTLQTRDRRKFEEEKGNGTSAFDKQGGLPLAGGVPLRGMAALNRVPCPKCWKNHLSAFQDEFPPPLRPPRGRRWLVKAARGTPEEAPWPSAIVGWGLGDFCEGPTAGESRMSQSAEEGSRQSCAVLLPQGPRPGGTPPPRTLPVMGKPLARLAA